MRPRRPSPPTPVASLYVHAPFCARRCVYCDFAVHVRRQADAGEWTEAVGAELDALRAEGWAVPADRLETLYVGGGTPSLLGPDAMARLARTLGPERLSGRELEWTAEANPESFTPRLARAWRGAGVNRVSLGVQTFHEPALRWMGRLHGSEGALRAVRTARDAGLEELSVDLIFGLPVELGRSWRDDLERVIALGPPHVSLYGLTVEPETPLGRAVAAGRETVADEERYREEFLEAAERLTAAGWVHYEVSNFARPGHESRHNRVYWKGEPYLGLGNGAHSFVDPVRRWNLRDWPAYHESVAEGRLPREGEESLAPDARRLEDLWLALRTREGLARDRLGAPGLRLAEGWARDGLARLEPDAVRLTAEGWLVMDRLVVELDHRDGS